MKTRRFGVIAACAGALFLAPVPVPAKDAAAGLELARQLNQAFVDVAAKVSPSVVVIDVVQKPSTSGSDFEEEDGDSDSLPPGFWREFHRQFSQPHTPHKGHGKGSGIILRSDGYLLTNAHVVEDAETIEVRLQDGRRFAATIRGVDRQSDLAVLKVEAKGLPAAALGNSAKTRIGEFALAIGAPYSLDYSVTIGHISGKSRSNVLPPGFLGASSMDQDFLQTDASINPGNSGGPLVNLDGEVIGINTLIHGLHTGIGFAIPSNLAREISAQLIADGKARRAWLGVEIHGVSEEQPEFQQLLGNGPDGVVVRSILPNGPAAKSDLRPSDIIVSVEGKAVHTAQQLRGEIRGRTVGKPVTLDIYRLIPGGHGKALKIKVVPGEWVQPTALLAREDSPSAPAVAAPAQLGLTVRSLTAELASQFDVAPPQGVVVATVEKDSLAARNGIQPGDLVTALNQEAVATPDAFNQALKRADLKKGVIINLISGKIARFEILKAD